MELGAIHRFPAVRRGESLTPVALVYLVVVAVATAVATVPLVLQIQADEVDWYAFAFLAVGATISQLFVVKTPRHQSYHMTAVFLVAAVLLLPPGLVVAIVVIAHVPEWIRFRYRWYIQGFNICNYALAAIAASGVTTFVAGLDRTPQGEVLKFALAGAAASVVFVLLNHAVLAQMLRVARAKSYRETGLFTLESLSTELVLAGLGVGVAGVWAVARPLTPFMLATLILLHRSLSLPNIQAAANLDTKTELFNARFLQTALADELARAQRFERSLSIVLADLDFLREINNTHGHLAGDAVLRGVADALRSQLRPYDIPSRFGGEEFAVLLPETSYEEALEIAERIRCSVEEAEFMHPHGSGAIHATISLGVASYPVATTADELIHQADLALYNSKAMGRNRVSGAVGMHAEGHRSDGAPLLLASTDSKGPSSLRRAVERVGHLRPVAGPSTRQAMSAAAQPTPRASVLELITALAAGAAVLIVLSVPQMVDAFQHHPLAVASFFVFAVALQLMSANLYGRGTEAASVIATLGVGFLLGPAPAIATAFLIAIVHVLRRGGARYRVVFDLANFPVSAATATFAYAAVTGPGSPLAIELLAALVAGVAYKVVNVGLLCLAMSLDERTSIVAVWRDRFSWASFHYVAFGPLGLATALAYDRMGPVGLLTFAIPAMLLAFSMRQYMERTREMVSQVQEVNTELEESRERLRRQHTAMIAALSRSMEAKDNYSGAHIERVSTVAVLLAEALGYSDEDLHAIEVGALMHDIGKIGIPEQLLTKADPLTPDEWQVIKQHPVISDYILTGIEMHPFVRQIVRSSHERIDGTGYPDRLAGPEIPLPARIVFVADAFDAITSDRPYRPRRSIPEALEELRANAGTQFCATVIAALELIWHDNPDALRGTPPAEERTSVPALRAVRSVVAAA